MEILQKKEELKSLCRGLGILDNVKVQYTKAGKPNITKLAYVRALQEYYLTYIYGKDIPKHVRMSLKYLPQLAARMNQVGSDEKIEALWNDPNRIAEEKFDGYRMVLIWVRGEGLHLFSRHISSMDFLPIKHDNVWLGSFNPTTVPSWIDSFVVDSEITSDNAEVSTIIGKRGVITVTHLQAVSALLQLNARESLLIQQDSAPLTFNMFDIMEMNGTDLRVQNLATRRSRLQALKDILRPLGLRCKMPEWVVGSKDVLEEYVKGIWKSGGEGIILKDTQGVYESDKRPKSWVKVKRTASQALEDSIDGFVTGFIPGSIGSKWEGKVASLEVSSYVRYAGKPPEVKLIAVVSNFSDEERADMSTMEGGEVALDPDYYDSVVEVDGQAFHPKSRTLQHATLIRWRPDKSRYDCIIDEKFISSQIL